jgi:hypothetical protein
MSEIANGKSMSHDPYTQKVGDKIRRIAYDISETQTLTQEIKDVQKRSLIFSDLDKISININRIAADMVNNHAQIKQLAGIGSDAGILMGFAKHLNDELDLRENEVNIIRDHAINIVGREKQHTSQIEDPEGIKFEVDRAVRLRAEDLARDRRFTHQINIRGHFPQKSTNRINVGKNVEKAVGLFKANVGKAVGTLSRGNNKWEKIS